MSGAGGHLLLKGCWSAEVTLAEMKSRMFCVDPTTPMPRSRWAAMARANISPGTCATPSCHLRGPRQPSTQLRGASQEIHSSRNGGKNH